MPGFSLSPTRPFRAVCPVVSRPPVTPPPRPVPSVSPSPPDVGLPPIGPTSPTSRISREERGGERREWEQWAGVRPWGGLQVDDVTRIRPIRERHQEGLVPTLAPPLSGDPGGRRHRHPTNQGARREFKRRRVKWVAGPARAADDGRTMWRDGNWRPPHTPNTRKSSSRNPLQELLLQPCALQDPNKNALACSSLTPMLDRLRLREACSPLSPVKPPVSVWPDFAPELPGSLERRTEADPSDAKEQLIPRNSSTPRVSAEVLDPSPKSPASAPSPLQDKSGGEWECLTRWEPDVPDGGQAEAGKEAGNISLDPEARSPSSRDTRECEPTEDAEVGSLDDAVAAPEDAGPPRRLTAIPSLPGSEHQERDSQESPERARSPAASGPLSGSSVPGPPGLPVPATDAPAGPGTGDTEPAAPGGGGPDPPGAEETTPGAEAARVAPGPMAAGGRRTLVTSTGTQVSPFSWLEKGVNTSALWESLCQSFSLPAGLREAGAGTTPIPKCSVGTWLTPPAFPEKSVNAGRARTQDNAAETDSLLWCVPPDLNALSRRELEDRLLSSLIILEALSGQLRARQAQGTAPPPDPPSRRDGSTQTDVTSLTEKEHLYQTLYIRAAEKLQDLKRNRECERELEQARSAMQSWTLESQELLSLLGTSLRTSKEDLAAVHREGDRAESAVSRCQLVLEQAKAALQHFREERDQARCREEEALRGKEAAKTVLEVFCAHSSQRISQLQQDLASQRELCGLLREAQAQQESAHQERGEVVRQAEGLASTMQEDWLAMQLNYATWAALLKRSHSLMERLAADSHRALREHGALRQERDEAVEEREQVSKQLAEVSAQWEDSKSQMERLALENGRLEQDLHARLQSLARTEGRLEELQGQHAGCAPDLAAKDEALARLAVDREEREARWQREEAALRRANEELREQQAALAREVRDLRESLEFMDQESQVTHSELATVESQLKATLSVHREQKLQCEELKDTVEHLLAEQVTTKAEAEELRAQLEKMHRGALGLGPLTASLHGLALSLRAALREDEKEGERGIPDLSTACTPARRPPPPDDSTFLGSVLRAVAGEKPVPGPVPGPGPSLGSHSSAFTRVEPAMPPKLAGHGSPESPDIERSLAELESLVSELQSLGSLLRESKEEAVAVLQRELDGLRARLEAEQKQQREALAAQEAKVEQMSQALCTRYKNEKELQEVIRQQDKKILQQIDKSGEVTVLQEEVAQLRHLLQRAETKAKVLQEELACQQGPGHQSAGPDWMQEKVWLRQEVDQLRLRLLEVEDEKTLLLVKSKSHRNVLEENLRRSEKELGKLDTIIEQIRETLLNIPKVVGGCRELQGLLELLG
ncbi:sperm-associated antigen 5 [Tachyglossus aculeatus]|uniref:sperm-associated antigen 5 n=1 Tax=Tachyglossus aculeatus TaxID=9261 RepID=UPI0018F5B48F|nr:sperm-associated antigen 5 [Tachyglossus aculeatus]